MDFLEMLMKKRDGKQLTESEIDEMITAYVDGEIPDYQMSAFLMAVYFNGMGRGETSWLTKSMAQSGESLDLSNLGGFKVDKHSTGGVGDAVSLILVPLVAALGMKIGKLSGRGLGHTGGTIDKLESIPGFRVDLTTEEFRRYVDEIGLAIMEHTSGLVPADQKLYSLRDVTGTVESLPLIISSIMSKKIACKPDGIVLDVKVGKGAFMKDLEEAVELGRRCRGVGEEFGLNVTALITDMNQPLGKSVGNALEVEEAIGVLKGHVDSDLAEVSLNLAAELYLQSGGSGDIEEGLSAARAEITSGSALEKFRNMVEKQSGNPRVVDNPDLLPRAENERVIYPPREGYIKSVDALKIGQAAGLIGAGRSKKGESIDPAAGIRLECRVGDKVVENDPIARLFYDEEKNLSRALKLTEKAFSIGDSQPGGLDLIKKRIRG